MLVMLTTDDRSGVEHLLSSKASALLAVATDEGGALRVACQIDNDPLIAQAGEGRTLVSLQGLVELSFGDGPEPAWVDVSQAVASALAGELDLGSSTVAVGTVHELLPATTDDLLLVMGAHRAPALDHDEFCQYWLGTHAPLALSMLDDDGRRRMGYQQFHTDRVATLSAAGAAGLGAAGFDGVLQVGLSTFEDLPHVRVPGFAETILADEANFADQSAEMRGAFMTTLPIRTT